jgi:mercuric ion transport protein
MAASEQVRESISARGGAEMETGRRVGKTVASVGGILAAIGVGSCCVIPFSLAMIGVSGAWIGNFTALAPYQPYFIALTVAFLAAGFYLVYRKPKAACVDGSSCAQPGSSRITKIALWLATVLFIAGVAFPHAAPILL